MPLALTDRSRYERGTKGCQRARYWGYEYAGTGIRLRAESLPLATGIHVHDAVEQLLRVVKAEGQIPDRLFVRDVVKAVTDLYRAECSKRGFQEEDTSEATEYVIQEQSCLIEGLLWAFYRSLLPWLWSEFELVAIEEEIEFPIGCTCGLGDGVGSFEDHGGRGCQGVGLMLRPDLVLRRRSDGQLGIADLKTSAYSGDVREEDFVVQLACGAAGAQKEHGEEVTFHYLLGAYKGKREADKGEKVKRQRSPLCYLYYRPADPPFNEPTYRAGYTRERGFGRVPVWECFSPEERGEGSAVEHWVMDMMSAEEAGACVGISGPHQRQTHLEKDILTEILTEELDVRQRVLAVECGELSLSEAFRRSWDCFEYGKPCEFLPICKKQAGWEAPEKSGRYERREPHHLAEELLFEARGKETKE